VSDISILFDATCFNLTEVRPHFINPCCFGEDTALWLRDRLREKAMAVAEPGQEDWGWYIGVRWDGADYFIGIGGDPDDARGESDQGTWRLMIQKIRSPRDKLFGKNRMTPDDGLVAAIREILSREPAFSDIRDEVTKARERSWSLPR
jgi:hypothetical protein